MATPLDVHKEDRAASWFLFVLLFLIFCGGIGYFFSEALKAQANPGVSVSYDDSGVFAIPDVRVCLETFEIGPQTFPYLLANLQGECLVDNNQENPAIRNGSSADVDLQPLVEHRFFDQFLSFDKQGPRVTPNSNCNVTWDSQCLLDTCACAVAEAPCLHFSFKNRAAKYGKLQSFYTNVYSDLIANPYGPDKNCFNRTTTIRPGGPVLGPTFDALRVMVLLNSEEGIFEQCPSAYPAVWLSVNQWNQVLISLTRRKKLDGTQVTSYAFAATSMPIYSVEALLDPTTPVVLFNTTNRVIITWSVDARGWQVIKELSPWPNFVATVFAISSVFGIFQVLYVIPEPHRRLVSFSWLHKLKNSFWATACVKTSAYRSRRVNEQGLEILAYQ